MTTQAMRIVAIVNTIVVIISAVGLVYIADRLFNEVKRGVSSEVFEDLGRPPSLIAALRDPQRRWHSFMKERRYLDSCSPEHVAIIKRLRLAMAVIFLYWTASSVLVVFCWAIANK